ncbi:FAD-dependent oxidoreductase [Pseudoduganella eburnea]|uniref:FAD-dependent oxidoreductase n=1 Tax=Massilia eburnea TaxID=1776165 RepID=A0A6L6QDC2_9BURK|nr:FAD-dependent oxidoreductase [Massilia eburnea]MTW10091.1 FAD-dependent oxidoreductase [Massilia eburnea]
MNTWMDAPADLQKRLEGMVEGDVIIVGGGIPGLSAALEFHERGAKVILLEQEFAGAGANGRNAGYLAGSIQLEYDLLDRRVGFVEAARVVGIYDKGVAYVEDQLRRYGIDCGYSAGGMMRGSFRPSEEPLLAKDAYAGIAFGARVLLLDQDSLRALQGPAFVSAICTPDGGTLDPGMYVAGLRRAVLEAGIKLYEGTPMLSFEDGGRVTVKTPLGKARAPTLVFATNAYSPRLGMLPAGMATLRATAVEVGPLSEDQLATLDLPRRLGVLAPRWAMESFRITPRNTLVATAKRLNDAYGLPIPSTPSHADLSEIVGRLYDRFPALRGAPVVSRWSGYASLANTTLPMITVSGNVVSTSVCCGHGIGLQSLTGEMLADQVDGSGAEVAAVDVEDRARRVA